MSVVHVKKLLSQRLFRVDYKRTPNAPWNKVTTVESLVAAKNEVTQSQKQAMYRGCEMRIVHIVHDEFQILD